MFQLRFKPLTIDSVIGKTVKDKNEDGFYTYEKKDDNGNVLHSFKFQAAPKKATLPSSDNLYKDILPQGTPKTSGAIARDQVKAAAIKKYPGFGVRNLFDDIDDETIERNLPLADQAIQSNIRSGAIKEKDLPSYPYLQSGLAVSYAADELNKPSESTRARNLAYTKEDTPYFPDTQLLPADSVIELPTRSPTPIMDIGIKKYKEEKAKKEENRQNALDNASNVLTVASLVPGIDTVADAAAIPVDIARDDWDSAWLDLFGVIPAFGEIADGAKTVKKAPDIIKAIDNTIDVAKSVDTAKDAGKAVDRTVEVAKGMDAASDVGKAADTATDTSKAIGKTPSKNVLPENDSQIKHIFRHRDGHLPDTPQNRKILTDTANDPDLYYDDDKYGNAWHIKTGKNGEQTWTRSQNGKINEGGYNTTPRPWDPETGLFRNINKKQ